MTPEYYANEFRRYQSFIKKYGDERPYKIACGPNAQDYRWTEVLMREAARFMDGLSLHYYTLPQSDWKHKGSSTVFDAAEYYETLRKTLFMEELVTRHSAIMDQYDPERRVGLIVDEWGGWYDVEPGTVPGFLYQQNTMRDALIAGINLNIFNKHADRIHMANLAQVVNVLQSVILTEGERMLLTPTYHVFDLYQAHQGAKLLESCFAEGTVDTCGDGLAQLHESASLDAQGHVNLTLCNLSADQGAQVEVELRGKAPAGLQGRILTGDISAHNTFDAPRAVEPQAYEGGRIEGGRLLLSLPACSVLHVTVL